MNDLEAALVQVAEFLDEHGIPYMVIGGFANLHWGRPRLTQDLDVSVGVGEASFPEFIRMATARFQSRSPDPLEFARKNGIVLLRTREGVPIDLIPEFHPLVTRAIERAVRVDVGGRAIRFCTAEDLILLKLSSERPRDREDVEGVILRQARSLDRGYLDPLVEQLARALERPDILTFYRDCLRKAGPDSSGPPGVREDPHG